MSPPLSASDPAAVSASVAASVTAAVSAPVTTPGAAPAHAHGAAPSSAEADAPTAAELLDFVRRAAADKELIATLPLDPEGRTWLRLEGPGGSEAWLIGWAPGTGTGWHDHAESLGAFATAEGELTEHSLAVRLPASGWKTLELNEGVDRERRLGAGRSRAFGKHHVHEVLNESDTEHAVSVHAYYPPLPLLRRFSRSGAVLRLEHVERPEDWQ
ncbi:cysteine dioxygenase [Streptomyces sp. NPDC002889]|uniref:cysteine dioxygenase n=1 Tax=Streptomyces sp. NPDC002889 TaxID=3364669 RepID=UPI0036A0C38A